MIEPENTFFREKQRMKQTKNIVIFVSGNGSNMSKLISHFQTNESIHVSHVFSNKKECLGIQNARELGVKTVVFSKSELESGKVGNHLSELSPDLIVLAGFLLKIPASFTQSFENKIINVHPSLLPKFGGKGMYGNFVHQAVLEAKEKKSGITFHYVNEHYDEGNIIKQFECDIESTDTLSDLQVKIQQLEHTHFATVIEQLLLKTSH